MNSPAQLNGPRVSLVPLSLDQVEELCRHSADPSLWTWWIRKPPIDAVVMRQEVTTALASRDAGRRIPFAIYHQKRCEHIGSTSLWNHDPQHRSIEIGSTWLSLEFHGTGINRECKELLFAYAFNNLQVNRIVLNTDVLNLRSRRAIEKLGAQFEGVRRQDLITYTGRVRSSAYYSLLREEWLARPSISVS